jgi:FG-GAP-like repeat
MASDNLFRCGLLRAALGLWFFFISIMGVAQTINLKSLTVSPNAPVSGNTSKGRVTATTPAPAGGAVVSLSSSNTNVATVPASVEIPAGASAASFTVKTRTVSIAKTVTITATSANSVSAKLTVNPAATVNWNGGPGPAFPVTNQCFAGDFNGDGKTDLACYTGTGGIWNVVLSTGSGWKSESWDGGPGVAIPVTDQCFAADFNGDRKTDLACYTGNPGSWNIALSTGKGWKSAVWNNGPTPPYEWYVVPVGGQCFAGDFNGDGKTDISCPASLVGNCGLPQYGCTTSVWNTGLSTGTGWNLESWNGGPGVPGVAIPVSDQCFTGDFNGDGKTDLACWTGEGGWWYVTLSAGNSWSTSNWLGGPTPPQEWYVTPVGGQCFTGDFNGGDKADIACPASLVTCGGSICTSAAWNVALSTGTGWNLESWDTGGPGVAIPVTGQCLSGDFNGDGKTDLACWTGEGGWWYVVLSARNSWNLSNWLGGPTPLQEWYVTPVGGQCFSGDFNGDGITDVACYSGTGGAWNVALSTGKGW